MLNTRNFVLFIGIICFIILGIALTVIHDLSFKEASLLQQDNNDLTATAKLSNFSVVVEEQDESMTVSEKFDDARRKVLSYRKTESFDERDFVVREVPDKTEMLPIVQLTSDSTNDINDVLKCNNYTLYTGQWLHSYLLSELEGLRVVYDSLKYEAISDYPDVDFSLDVWNDFVVQLPIVNNPLDNMNCLRSDVVGIAKDGSLIRNNEYMAYGVFGKDTIIGYALDGFPIYGRDDYVYVDECGGDIGVEGYGYVLQTNRQSILNCYRGQPVVLPQ